MRQLPRAVWLLGWVSLATDAATEAVYPLLPLFLTGVLGAGVISLGIIEGAAEAVSSLLKIISGRLSDRARSRRGFVLFGYTVSSLSRPLIALAGAWTTVLAIRLIDRVGKGVRGAPRDAILAGWAEPGTRGAVFGFHRAMDHAGAIVGPLAATAFLAMYPGEYRTLFALTIIPGLIAVALILFVREPPKTPAHMEPAAVSAAAVPSDIEVFGAHESARLRAFLVALAIFTLGNSTDAYLLLRLSERMGSATLLPILWSLLHVVKAAMSIVGGRWSDRIGRRPVIVAGWVVYAAVYAGFAFSTSFAALVAWFLFYGTYFGLTESAEKAFIADLAPPSRRGFAFGLYTAVQGFGGLAASILFGVIWSVSGAPAAFLFGATLALAASALLLVAVPRGA